MGNVDIRADFAARLDKWLERSPFQNITALAAHIAPNEATRQNSIVSQISRWRKKKGSPPSLRTVAQYAAAFDVTVAEFYCDKRAQGVDKTHPSEMALFRELLLRGSPEDIREVSKQARWRLDETRKQKPAG